MEILIPVLIVVAIGIIAGLILALASKFFSVPVDEKVEAVCEALPGANCGGCGYSGCAGFAEAIVNDGADITLCGVGGADAVKNIATIMGVDAGVVRRRIAVVRCSGSSEKAKLRYEYKGLDSCLAASMLNGGPTACAYGCIGLGDCVNVCENDAIAVVDGVAKVDPAKCVACMKCANVCPRGIIVGGYAGNRIVECQSREKGAVTRKACTAGCIACGKCVKTCPSEAIKVENNLAVVDPDRCNGCGSCDAVCPVGVIHKV